MARIPPIRRELLVDASPATAFEVFTWHPGYEASRASMVEVTFSPSGDRTLVTLIHTGWEAFEDPDAAREEYQQGWPVVLKGYAEFVARPSSTIASSSSSTVIE